MINGRHLYAKLTSNLFSSIELEKRDPNLTEEAATLLASIVDNFSTAIHRWCSHYFNRIQLVKINANEMHAFFSLSNLNSSFSRRHPSDEERRFEVNNTLINIELVPSKYGNRKNPYWYFNDEHKGISIEYEWVKADDVKRKPGHFKRCPSTHNYAMDAMRAQSYGEQRAIVIDNMKADDVLKSGNNIMHNIRLLQNPLDPNEKPDGFPVWGQQKIDLIKATHPTLKEEGSCIDPEDCLLCHEYQVWSIFRWFYYEVFLKRGQKEDIYNANLEPVKMPCRLYGLVVLGPRETGKTKLMQVFCNLNKRRMVRFKKSVNRQQSLNFKDAWLTTFDDFRYTPDNYELLKAMFAGEATTVEGKWLQQFIDDGEMPPACVLTNDPEFFMALQKDENMASQCKFIDLRSLYVGPPISLGQRLVKMTGPKAAILPSRKRELAQLNFTQLNKYDVVQKKVHTSEGNEKLKALTKELADTKATIKDVMKENKRLTLRAEKAEQNLKKLQQKIALTSVHQLYDNINGVWDHDEPSKTAEEIADSFLGSNSPRSTHFTLSRFNTQDF